MQRRASGILKVFFRWIDDRKIQARFQELEQGIALQNQRRRFTARSCLRFHDGSSQQWKSLCKKTLLRAKPERAACARCKKTRAVRPRVVVQFPVQRANMLVRRAIAILSVSRTDAVTILRNLSGDPTRARKGRNHVAHQLRLTDAARMPVNDNHAPPR